jgi:hypothetical protein
MADLILIPRAERNMKNIERLRIEQKVTRAWLADRSGYHLSSITGWCTGRNQAGVFAMECLLEALGYGVDKNSS